MSIQKTVRLNALLIASIGIQGFMTDEPYWRAVGHSPGLYDYFFWSALALNGPSGFAADYAAWLATDIDLKWQALIQHREELRFVVQYLFWLLLLWPQWKAYDIIACRCAGHPRRERLLRLAALGLVLIGCVGIYETWRSSHRIGLFFIERHFWTVRIAGVALSGVVILVYGHVLKQLSARPESSSKA
jgi:hypothetical protein